MMTDQTYDPQNIFARILRGEIPCQRIVETDYGLSFADVNPQAPVHVLVIPKVSAVDWGHFTAIADAQQVLGYHEVIARTLVSLDLSNGYRLIVNSGEHGGQEVPHLHVHILAGRPLGKILSPGD